MAMADPLIALDVLVYSAHKTGTQTLVHTFRESGLACAHCHRLSNLNPPLSPERLPECLREYRRRRGRPLVIVSVFREPIDRHISSFFQWHGEGALRRQPGATPADSLLARASVTIASLRSAEIMALMGQILEHLVAGELMQLTAGPDDALSMEHYMRKTFYKTASLMANACKAVAVVAGCPAEEAAAAWDYGHHTGLAFQLVDDILDFTGTAEELGKPAGHDLRSGLATAPVLFAAQQRPELIPLVKRRFREEGDGERALKLVEATDGLARARALAEEHSAAAAAALNTLPPAEGAAAAEARAALEEITRRVINRKK